MIISNNNIKLINYIKLKLCNYYLTFILQLQRFSKF